MSPLILYAIAGFFIGGMAGSWHPLAMFAKKPPTEQLTQLQAQLTKAQSDSVAAVKAVEDAKSAERAKLEAQIRSAQQDNLGASEALKKAPITPETKLAQRMTQRVSLKLASAIGKLPQEEQDAMIELIQQALSDKQAEVDAANAKLASMDADFKAVTGEREQLRGQIPLLTQRAVKAEETAQKVQGQVTLVTDQVKKQADKLFQADQESGSLWNGIKGLVGLLIFLAFGWAFLAFIVPALLKFMPSNPFKSVLRDVSGFAVGGLHYLDARKKLNDFNSGTQNKSAENT